MTWKRGKSSRQRKRRKLHHHICHTLIMSTVDAVVHTTIHHDDPRRRRVDLQNAWCTSNNRDPYNDRDHLRVRLITYPGAMGVGVTRLIASTMTTGPRDANTCPLDAWP